MLPACFFHDLPQSPAKHILFYCRPLSLSNGSSSADLAARPRLPDGLNCTAGVSPVQSCVPAAGSPCHRQCAPQPDSEDKSTKHPIVASSFGFSVCTSCHGKRFR